MLKSLSEEGRNHTFRVSIVHAHKVTEKPLVISQTPGDRSAKKGENDFFSLCKYYCSVKGDYLLIKPLY